MADAADYSQLTSALSNLSISNTNLANTLNNSFGSTLTASIESAFQKISQQKKSLPVHDAFLSERVFNKDWLDRENTKVNTLKAINDLLHRVDFQTLNTKLNDTVKTIADSLKPGNNSSSSSNLNNSNSASVTDKDFRQKTLDFYSSTLRYLDAIASHTKLNSSVGQMGSLLGGKLGNLFGGGEFGKAFGNMLGDTMSHKMQDILTRIFNGESISKILYGMLKGTVGRLLSTVFAPVKTIWKGVKGALGFAGNALLKFSEIVFGASARVKDFFEKVTPLKSLLGIIPEAVAAVTDFVNMLVMFPINKIKETQQLAYSTMDSLTGKINDVMATYGVGQEQAMRMIFQQEVMLQQMPYIYRDSFKVQADITEQYRNLIKTTGMTLQQAQGLAPVLDKFKNSILEGIDLAGSTLVKLGSKLYGNLDQIVDSYGSTLIKLQNSMNINASQVNQQFQDNFAEYFELTTYNSDELIDKSTSMIKTLAELNSTVIDSNKLLQNINANRDKTMSEFFSTDFGRSVMMTSSNPQLAKMWLDSRKPEDLAKFYEDRFAGIQRRLAGFTPETLNTEFAYTYLKSLNIDVDEARQVLRQGATAQTFQKFSEEKKADRWEEVLKTLAQDYRREWDRGHVFIGPDSDKLLRMGETWGESGFVKAWQDAIAGRRQIGINFDNIRNAQMLLSVMDAYFGKDFTANVLSFMSISVRIANDIFGALVHFSSATLKFIGHFATHGFDVFNPESGAYQNMIKDVLPSVAMGITASDFAAQNMSTAIGKFTDLMGQTVTSLTEGAKRAGEKYKGLNVGSFVSDPRLLGVANTTLKSLSAYNYRLDENGNPIYSGTDSEVAKQFGTRYAQLKTASASGPKAVFASISDQLTGVIYKAVSKALEGFPGYNIAKSISKSADMALNWMGNTYSTWLSNSNYQRQILPNERQSLFRQVAQFNPELQQYTSFDDMVAKSYWKDPEQVTEFLIGQLRDYSLLKNETAQRVQKNAIRAGIAGAPGQMFSQEEVSQMNPFGKPASQGSNSSSQLADSFKNQQGQQTVKNQTADINKQSVVNTANFIRVTHTFRDKVMEGLANETSTLTEGFDILKETSISSTKYLLDIRDTLVQLAVPGVIHFNKFNNNLSTKLNKYLEGMIEFIDAEKKEIERQKTEEEKAKREGKTPNSEDAVGGGEFTGYSGSVFDATITGPYHSPRSGSRGTYYHNGVDFGVSEGTPLPATENARVAFAQPGWNAGYGKLVILQGSKSGMYIGYAHLSDINVSQGGIVSPGQVIGKSGNTGHSFGPHLHFMVGSDDMFNVYDDKTINPLDYLRGKDIKVKGTYTGKQEKSRRGLRRFFNFSLGKKPGLESLASLVALVANSESGGNIAAVRDAVDRGYGKYQFTTLPGSFDNWDRFVRWLGARSEYSVLYDRLKNTNGADASSVRPAIQELAKTHHALFEKAQDQHVLEYWYNPIKNLVEGRSMPFKAAALSFSVQRGGLAPEILRKSGALSTANDREALIKLYTYAYKYLNDPGRYDKETKMLGIYEGMKRPYGGGEGIAYNATEPFTSYDSGLNLASSTISGTAFDGLRPFITGPMQSGSWQVDDRYNINQDSRTLSEAGVKQQHIYDYLSIWNNGRDISGSPSSGSIFGSYAQKRASTGDNTLYSMGWMGDPVMLSKHPEYAVKDPVKYGLVSSLDIAGAIDKTNPFFRGIISDEERKSWGSPNLEPGYSMQKKGSALVVVKTPTPPPAPPAGSIQKTTQQQQEMVDAMKTTAKAAVDGAKANEQTAKAVNKLAQQAESSKNIGPQPWMLYGPHQEVYIPGASKGSAIEAAKRGAKFFDSNPSQMKIYNNT